MVPKSELEALARYPVGEDLIFNRRATTLARGTIELVDLRVYRSMGGGLYSGWYIARLLLAIEDVEEGMDAEGWFINGNNSDTYPVEDAREAVEVIEALLDVLAWERERSAREALEVRRLAERLRARFLPPRDYFPEGPEGRFASALRPSASSRRLACWSTWTPPTMPSWYSWPVVARTSRNASV